MISLEHVVRCISAPIPSAHQVGVVQTAGHNSNVKLLLCSITNLRLWKNLLKLFQIYPSLLYEYFTFWHFWVISFGNLLGYHSTLVSSHFAQPFEKPNKKWPKLSPRRSWIWSRPSAPWWSAWTTAWSDWSWPATSAAAAWDQLPAWRRCAWNWPMWHRLGVSGGFRLCVFFFSFLLFSFVLISSNLNIYKWWVNIG